jgi:hypothetical protein
MGTERKKMRFFLWCPDQVGKLFRVARPPSPDFPVRHRPLYTSFPPPPPPPPPLLPPRHALAVGHGPYLYLAPLASPTLSPSTARSPPSYASCCRRNLLPPSPVSGERIEGPFCLYSFNAAVSRCCRGCLDV